MVSLRSGLSLDSNHTPRRCDTLVVGGGLTGCAAAYELAREGVDVLLVDRGSLNSEASGRNAGGLHVQIQFEPFVVEGEEWSRSWAPSGSWRCSRSATRCW